MAAAGSEAFPALSKSISVFLDTLKGGQGVIKAFSAGLTTLVAAHPIIAAVAAAAATIFAVVKIVDAVTVSAKEAQEAMNQSFSEYEDAKSKVEELNNQLEETKSKIEALESKDGLTFVEQSELDKLREVQKVLELQKDLAEREADRTAREAADSAVTAFRKNFKNSITKSDVDEYETGADLTGNNAILVSDEKNVAAMLAAVRQWKELRAEAYKEGNLEDVEWFDGLIQETTDSIWEQTNTLTDYKTKLESVPFGKLSADAQAALSDINGAIDLVYQELDPAKFKQMKFDDLFGGNVFANARKEIEGFIDAENNIGVTAEQVQSVLEKYPALAQQLRDAGISINDIVGNFNSSAGIIDFNTVKNQIYKDFVETFHHDEVSQWLNSLSDDDLEIVYQIKCQTDTAKFSLSDWKNTLEQYKDNYTDITIKFDIQAETDGLSKLTSAINESNSATGLSADSIKALQERYSDLDTSGLFENTARGVQLNVQALGDLESAYKANAKIKLADDIRNLCNEYNRLTDKIDNCSDATEKLSLEERRNNVKAKIDEAAQLAAQYNALTSAYNEWLNAQGTADQDDAFNKISNGINGIKELYEQGKIGTDDFRAAVQMMTDVDLSGMAPYEILDFYDKGMATMERYFTGSSEGLQTLVQDINKVNEAWAFQDETGGWHLDFGKDGIEGVAAAMNDVLGLQMSTEELTIMLNALEAYGWDIKIGSDINDLLQDVESTEAALRALDAEPVAINVDSDEIGSELQHALDLIDEINNSDAEPEIKAAQIEDANAKINVLLQRLNESAVLSIETDNSDVQSAIDLVSSFVDAYNDYQVAIETNVDVDNAKSSLDAALSSMQGNEIIASMDIDTSSVESAVNSIPDANVDVAVNMQEADIPDQTANIIYIVDDAAVQGYTPPDKDATVKFGIDSSAPDGYTPPNKSATVYYNVVTQGGSRYQGTAHLDGTAMSKGSAHIRGGAYMAGDWGTPKSENALVGELGQEIIAYNGKFWTVGDNGAEITHIPKGAIIFNADQSEQILKYGKISTGKKRGAQYSDGTVKAHVSGASYATSATGSGKFIFGETSKKVIGKGSGSSSSSSSSSSTPDDDKFEKIDWIEIAIDRIERSIKALTDAAASAYKTLANRLKSSSKAVDEISSELITQEEAMNRYLREAQSVGLSSHLAEKVRNGEINIASYDEDTRKLIEDYQEWYEKALDCADAIDELHESLADLYKDNFDAINDNYDNQIAQIEHTISMYEATADLMEAQGKLSSANIYSAMYEQTKNSIPILQQQSIDLRRAMEVAVNSGEIEKYSEAWYDMQESINDVDEALAEANVQLAEYEKTMREIQWDRFDYLQDRISQLTSESDFLIDLLSYSDLFDDKGNMTDEGMSTLGLHGANYNTYMAQADAYAAELAAINKSMASDPYNTDLIARREELLELQQKNIIAAEDEKKAMIDLVAEGIDAQISSMQDLIDSYTNSIEEAKSLYDYQKKISDQTKKVAEIEKQLAAYQNDTSEETKATVQKLKVSLEEAQNDLKETEYEHYISEQKKLLSGLMDDFSSMLNSRLDDTNALLSQIVDGVNNNAVPIGDNLADVAGSVGYAMSENMVTLWNSGMGNIEGVISTYSAGFDSKLTSVNFTLSTIEGYLAKMANASDAYASVEVSNQTGNLVVPKYARGGFANFTGLAHLDGSASRPEVVLNPDDTQNFLELRNMLRELSVKELTIEGMTDFAPSAFATPKLTGITDMSREVAKFREGVWSQNSSVTFGDINIGIDHVENYEDFITKLQHDRNFEKMVAGMTVGRLSGGGSLDKYKYNLRK